MRVVHVLVAFALAGVALAAQPTLKAVTVRLTVNDITVGEAFRTLSRTTGVEILIDERVSDDVLSRKTGRVKFADAELASVLKFLADRAELALDVIDEKTVVVRPKTAA